MRRTAAWLLVATLGHPPHAAADGSAPPPDLVLLVADDLRWDGLGATGNPYVETPHLDRLAREGMTFTHAFVTTSMCCPSRVSLLTGRYAPELGVHSNRPAADFQEGRRILPQLLQEVGYRTAFVGKWHLPNPGAMPRPGFDRWVSFEDQGVYLDQPLNVDGEPVATHGFSADVLTDHAVEWIVREDARPLFLLLSYKNCHLPFVPPARDRGSLAGVEILLPESFDQPLDTLPSPAREARLNNRNRGARAHPELYRDTVRAYWELVPSLDRSVGRVLAALEDAGRLERALVVFTSDNGYLLGEHGLTQKQLSYDPSIRVPLVARLPGTIPPSSRFEGLTLNVDLTATLADLAGAEQPDEVRGRSLLPIWRDPRSPWRDAILHLAPWTDEASQRRERAVRTPTHKFVAIVEPGGVEEALFDLRDDPDETRDLLAAGETAEEHAALRDGLRARLAELVAELDLPGE